MRTALAAVTLGLCLGWAAPIMAQQQSSSFWTGADPRKLTFTPINTSNLLKTYNTTNIIRPPQQQKAFNLSTIFHTLSMPSWPPRLGSSPQPDPSKNPILRRRRLVKQ